jgi:hypothetical protein
MFQLRDLGCATPPSAPSPTSNSPQCSGSTLNLTANVTGNSYSWTGPNGFTSTAQNPSISSVTTGGSGTYTLTYYDSNGCGPSSAGTTSVTVNAAPSVTASNNAPLLSGVRTISNGQSVTLSATTATGVSFSWSGANGFSSTAQNPTVANVTGASSPYSDYNYTVTTTDAGGCTGQGSTTVRVSAVTDGTVPDLWKTQHGYLASKPMTDTVANGLTLLQSYLAGVDPTCGTCKLNISNISVTASAVVTVDWTSQQDGTTPQRLYDIWYTTGPFGDGVSWTRPLSNQTPDGVTSSVEDDISSGTFTQRFYRITIAGHTNDVATPEIAGVHKLTL